MRKIITIMAIITMLVFSGCSSHTVWNIQTEEKSDTSIFVQIEKTPLWRIVYHSDTKVIYAVSQRNGEFTVMVNPDGSPMLWEGDT